MGIEIELTRVAAERMADRRFNLGFLLGILVGFMVGMIFILAYAPPVEKCIQFVDTGRCIPPDVVIQEFLKGELGIIGEPHTAD
jgi:hypothetical protein